MNRARASWFALALTYATLAPAGASLSRGERTALTRYLDALAGGRYADAYARLSDDERRYFGSARNYASAFAADRFRLRSYRLLGSEATAKGTVVLVSERVAFYDQARETPATALAKTPYAVIRASGGYAIRDPGHPWRAVAPASLATEASGIRASIRKISFFTGRVEFVIRFENRGAGAVTLLPYGRSIVRDGRGNVYHPVAVREPSVTDPTLYGGLRLPSSSAYTGFLTFATPDRFEPATLSLSLGPALARGADQPFSLDFAPYAVPS